MSVQLGLKAEFHDHQGAIREIKIHASLDLFFARSDLMLIMYVLSGCRKLQGFYDSAGYSGAAFSPEGTSLVYASGEKVHFFDLREWQEKMVMAGDVSESRDRDVHVKSGLVADGDHSGKIYMRKIDSDEYSPPDYVLEGHNNYIEYLSFHPSGRYIASGSADMTLRFWDLNEKAEISCLKVHDDFVTAIAFSSDGKWMVSGDYSGKMKVWEVSIS